MFFYHNYFLWTIKLCLIHIVAAAFLSLRSFIATGDRNATFQIEARGAAARSHLKISTATRNRATKNLLLI